MSQNDTNKKVNTEPRTAKKSPYVSATAAREEEVLQFWKENKIFEKSLEKDAPKGEFVFYDGPPFATGLPHYGSLLSSIIKDVIPRYKTMRGYRVRRRWGWDTHGLPIESLVEKKLGLKSKKDIENIGVAKFNEEARNMVLEYAHDWQKYIERVGRWVEFENSYKTMDNSYIESVWWALSQMNKKGLLYEGRKVLMYCPHCETPLAKAEIAMDNSYKDVTEESVTIKFEIINSKLQTNSKFKNLKSKIYFLAWTTTPWTLPGNVALAVGEDIDYVIAQKRGEYLICAEALADKILKEDFNIEEKIKGSELVGIEYEPLYEINKVSEISKKTGKAWRVYGAPFVNIEEGTGIVHTAVIYGEEDYELGLKEGLPMVPLLDASGKYNDDAPEFLKGKYIKNAEDEIKADLEKRGLLFDKFPNTHAYPHCYRCGTPLIYNAVASWFINIQKIKSKLISLNEKINWVPKHLKEGRFKNILENAPDWTISRNRYWASPLPIWKNEKTGEFTVIGSIEELREHSIKSGNEYFAMRHGESEANIDDLVNFDKEGVYHLTEEGKRQVNMAVADIKRDGIDIIISSPMQRCRETAEIVRNALGLGENALIFDARVGEYRAGLEFEGKSWSEFHRNFESEKERFEKTFNGGENLRDLHRRVGELLYELDSKYKNKRILLVSHQMTIRAIYNVSNGLDLNEKLNERRTSEHRFNFAQYDRVNFIPLPHNRDFELDLHKPYIDEITLVDRDGTLLKRTPEVIDCWAESGSMPFAEWHYPFDFAPGKPFENKTLPFPGDFIAEYIAQTRTWFYYMHVIATAIFGDISFRNVITTGNILASDGSKMSKSKGNYTDPLENFDKFGADALRLYLMGSVVMQAEDIAFKDEDYKENMNRVVNILWNCFAFFDMYRDKDRDTSTIKQSKNILDRWIISRLNKTAEEITNSLEEYNTVKAARAIRPFVEDFSTWYLRRSRDRFKDGNLEDRKMAEGTTRFVLIEFSKLIAPIMPFISEYIYQKLRTDSDCLSVHLLDWPEANKVEEKVLEDMQEVRRIVSLALEKRNSAGIKIRQPLSKLKIKRLEIKNLDEYETLIKGEVNVKEIIIDESISDEVELDTEITAELQKEGNVRDFVRAVQELRKQKKLKPSDAAVLVVETDAAGKEFLNSVYEEVKRPANISELQFGRNDGENLEIGNYKFKINLNF